MRPEQRLRRPADFSAVYKSGHVEGNRLLVVRTRPNGAEHSRFGFVTTKAVGNAVTRNRVKRRLRAIADTVEVVPGLDIVVSARKAAVGAQFAELERGMRTLLARAGALTADGARA